MFLVNVPEGTVRDDDLCFFAPLIAGHLGLYEAVLVQRLHIDLRQPTYVVDDVPWIERSYAEFSEREEISTTTVSRAMKTGVRVVTEQETSLSTSNVCTN